MRAVSLQLCLSGLAVAASIECQRTDLECFAQHVEQQLTLPCARPLAVALVGAGAFARKAHLPSLRAAGDCFRLVAIWSRSRGSAEALAAGERIFYGEEGWRELLSSNLSLELLDVVLPFPQQPRFIAEAVAKGFKVLSEKPIASSSHEAKEMASSDGWWVAENWRFEPSFRIAALLAKTLGEVLAFSGSSLSFMPAEVTYAQQNAWRMLSDGNWIVDVGVHFAAAFRLVLGDLQLVQAVPRRIRPELRPFDSFAATLTAGEALGTWIFSLSVPPARPRDIPGLSDLDLQISGRNGTVLVSRGKVELLDSEGQRLARFPKDGCHVAPSVSYALRAAVRGVLKQPLGGMGLEPWEAMKDLELVEAVLSKAEERLEL